MGKILFLFTQIIAINELNKLRVMSFTTYYMHLIFASISHIFSSDLILYILSVLSVSILFFSFKIMFYKAPKLRRAK